MVISPHWYHLSKDGSVRAKLLQLCLIVCSPRDCTRQAPLSMGFFRQEYWSGLPFPSLGDLPDPGVKSAFLSLAGDSLRSEEHTSEL